MRGTLAEPYIADLRPCNPPMAKPYGLIDVDYCIPRSVRECAVGARAGACDYVPIQYTVASMDDIYARAR